jgi:hypothetical protein
LLSIDPGELAFADRLVPLLGRSPRALKRFTNVYRLMKVRLDDKDWHSFLANGSYKRVLFLLALVTNAPELATFLFHQIDKLAAQPEQSPWNEFCNYIDSQVPEDQRRAWQDVRRWLLTPGTELPLPGGALDLRDWTRHVARYSFLIDSLDVGLGVS